MLADNWLAQIVFDEKGLVPVIAQDIHSSRVVMFAFMNRESLEASLQSGYAVYWSRSRERLWRKGEESGNVQKIHEIRLDCDGDVLLLMIEQVGGIACHTGRESCFYNVLRQSNQASSHWEAVDPVLKDPDEIYLPKS